MPRPAGGAAPEVIAAVPNSLAAVGFPLVYEVAGHIGHFHVGIIGQAVNSNWTVVIGPHRVGVGVGFKRGSE